MNKDYHWKLALTRTPQPTHERRPDPKRPTSADFSILLICVRQITILPYNCSLAGTVNIISRLQKPGVYGWSTNDILNNNKILLCDKKNTWKQNFRGCHCPNMRIQIEQTLVPTYKTVCLSHALS